MASAMQPASLSSVANRSKTSKTKHARITCKDARGNYKTCHAFFSFVFGYNARPPAVLL